MTAKVLWVFQGLKKKKERRLYHGILVDIPLIIFQFIIVLDGIKID